MCEVSWLAVKSTTSVLKVGCPGVLNYMHLVCVICLTTNAHCWWSWNMAVALIATHWLLLLAVVGMLQVD